VVAGRPCRRQFFNLILSTRLTEAEKKDPLAFLKAL